MAILARSQIIQPGDTVALKALFKGPDGLPADLDAFPEITVVQPSGGVAVGPTSLGMIHIGTGAYEFHYDVGLFPPIGVWKDVWEGSLDGFSIIDDFSFVVALTQMPAVNTDGYEALGDDCGFNYSQIAIHNVNSLLKSLRARLNSRGKHPTTDEFGNTIYKDCDIFSADQLISFIAQALSSFNETPHFTEFTFDDTPIIELFHNILTQGALYFALASQALIERGREFAITDNGVGFTPPTISEALNTQYQTEIKSWEERCKYIKANMKPAPSGLGVMSLNTVSPAIRRLRWLRARQIY